MRLSCRRPVVLAPTTCPQMRPKERDTDPEEEQCDRELRLRNAATGPGNWESRRDPPLEPPEGAQPCSHLDFSRWAPELQEDELRFLGPGLQSSFTATPDLEAGMFAEPPPPQEAPRLGGRMNPACRVRDGLGEGTPTVPPASSATRPAPS